MVDHKTVCLGARPPYPKESSRRVSFAAEVDRVAGGLPQPLEVCDWTCGATARPTFGNEKVGDCTCAVFSNIVIGVMRVVYKKLVSVSAEQTIALYTAVTGYDPTKTDLSGRNPTDRGAVVENVIAYVSKHGFLGHHMLGTAAIDPSDVVNIKRAIDWFGFVDLGVGLPVAWQGMKNWSAPTTWERLFFSAKWKKGSWGGHSVCSQKYDEKGLYVWSWGELYLVSWDAVAMYADTVDAILMASWIKAGLSPTGEGIAELASNLAALSQKAA